MSVGHFQSWFDLVREKRALLMPGIKSWVWSFYSESESNSRCKQWLVSLHCRSNNKVCVNLSYRDRGQHMSACTKFFQSQPSQQSGWGDFKWLCANGTCGWRLRGYGARAEVPWWRWAGRKHEDYHLMGYSSVDRCQCFGGACCIHLQGRKVSHIGKWCPDKGKQLLQVIQWEMAVCISDSISCVVDSSGFLIKHL